MHPVRRLLVAFSFAFALLAGQHVAALHDLGHALDRIAHKSPLPLGGTCNECFACAQLSGAVGPSLPVVPPVLVPDVEPCDLEAEPVFAAPRVAFLSRGPPALL